MDSKNEQQKPQGSKKNLIYGVLAALAALLGFYFFQNSGTLVENASLASDSTIISTPSSAVEQTVPISSDTADSAGSSTTAPAAVEEATPLAAPKPVDQPPKPKKKPSKLTIASKPAAPMSYKPEDFRPVSFFENMATSKSATSPAKMTSPTDNALILPDPKGDYRFQLGFDLICEKNDRIAIFPNNKAAFDAETPLYRHIFPTEHRGPWNQYIKLDSKPGLHYVVLQQPSGNRMLGKFILN